MEKIIIRKMRLADFEQVHKLVEQVNELHLNARKDIYKKADPLCYKDFENIIENSQYICYVAELNNIIVGEVISSLKEIKDENIFKHRLLLYIEDLCVENNYHKKGIGKSLYKKLVQIAQKNNVDSIELNVWSFNKNAIEFYNKLGMSPKSIRYEYKII